MVLLFHFLSHQVTHWQHPRFHAYFPSGNSYPSVLADMLSDAIGCIGFSWAASPSCTELETIVLDWLGKAIGLPEKFLMYPPQGKNATTPNDIDMNIEDYMTPANQPQSLGGGVIQNIIVLTRGQKKIHPFVDEGVLLSKLMAYCSKEAHSCVEKAAMMAFVRLKILEPDDKNSLRGATLRQVMQQDETMGYIPFFVSTTLGTTSCCSFDNLAEIGPVAKEFDVWLHVDGAYAGSSFICPEFRPFMNGIEYADSFNVNVNKWLLTAFDSSCLWVADRYKLTSALVVDPLYLQHGHEGAIDYRHWGIPLSRRFRSLKLWFVIRTYGLSGLQKYIRRHCELAKLFEGKVRRDPRFEISNDVRLGLVCFRLRSENNLIADQNNRKLLEDINASGRLHMVPASVHDKYVIRFCVTAQNANEKDIDIAWKIIQEFANTIVAESIKEQEQNDEVFELQERKRKDDLAYKRSFFVRMLGLVCFRLRSENNLIADHPLQLGLVCFRLRSENNVIADQNNRKLLEDINASGRLHMVPASVHDKYVIRFCVTAQNANEKDIDIAWILLEFRHLDTMVHLKKSRKEVTRVSTSPIIETNINSTDENNTNTALTTAIVEKDNRMIDRDNKRIERDTNKASDNNNKIFSNSTRFTTSSKENHVEVYKEPAQGKDNTGDNKSADDTDTITTTTTTRSTNSVITFELQERKRKDDLAYKRSFFVRMVSDPKIYNPKIAVATPTSRRPTCLASSAEEDEEAESDERSSEQGSYTPTSSWISWPLAFLLQSRMKEDAERGRVSDVPVRFRHLDTMVHLKKSRNSVACLAA
ncbi:tyrosine decarboxylase-like [Diaphorina citri]|uniref:Tyrosine decarboxylase-like n=1 Tax=Diaphorina citri TaxID=121845 RepID=A0A3Q0IL69_DIACI|nr:tyrosine decarboxylase-like [Diaphorina citri]